MRKELFNQSINDDIKQISMSGYRSFEAFASTRFGAETSYALMPAHGT